jgi:cytoskeleton protein RodZ
LPHVNVGRIVFFQMTKVTHLTLDEDGGLNRRRIHLREISGESETPLETVGQDLRAARLRLGEDLATVSRTLKIRKDHLEALEEDRFEALPGRAYAVGFIRSYSDYLGLDAVQCVERFKLEIAGRGEAELPVVQDLIEERRLPHGWLVIAAVVTALIIYGAYHLAMSADSLANQPVAAVPQQLEPKVAQTPKPVVPKPAQIQSLPLAPAAPSNTSQQLATTTPPPAATIPGATQPASEQPAASSPLQGQTYGGQNKNARVILRVHAATRITVEGPDGRLFINRILQPGDTYNVPLVQGVTLTAASGNAVELDLDGQSMGTVSKDAGETDEFPLDPQSVADHANGNPG